MSLTKEQREVYYKKLLIASRRRHSRNIRSKPPILEREEKIVDWEKLNNFINNKFLNAVYGTNL
jgi:hypothetical protein